MVSETGYVRRHQVFSDGIIILFAPNKRSEPFVLGRQMELQASLAAEKMILASREPVDT